MDPMDFINSSPNNFNKSASHSRDKDSYDLTFDPWGGTGGSHGYNQSSIAKKPRLDEDQANDRNHSGGVGLDEKGIITEPNEEDDEDEYNFSSRKNSEITSTTDQEKREINTSAIGLMSSSRIFGFPVMTNTKLVDEPEGDPEEDVSSPTTTPPPSSSEPEQTPRSSNEGDGDKSDRTESESSKLHPISTSNGSLINYISPSITKRSVTLQMLLAAGILKPGEASMSLEYHGQKFLGDLLENGQIRSQETSQLFTSPSAWATTCKQIINPDKSLKKSGCGWASIKYKSLKLDYYKAVWFKRLREGSIDIRNITNGAVSSSTETDDEDTPHCILKFGEHFENSPRHQTAQQIGAKVLISCTEFKEMERLQPFHVKVSAEAVALADFHCNITSTEAVGYISGQWNGDQNTLKMETIHPCRVLMPNSSTVECDNERNRIALQIQRLSHEVVGWYHSHPKAPPIPSKDDISRQLDYQIMMKGASEASYIPCVGIIISPLCYSEQSDTHKSNVQFFWVMPPPENRPLEMGRPMHVEYETYPSTEFDPRKLLVNMKSLIDFYKSQKELVDVNELGIGKLERLKETVSTWLPALKINEEFWLEIQKQMKEESLPQLAESVSCSFPILPLENSSSTSTSSSPAQMDQIEPDPDPPKSNLKDEEEQEQVEA